jgi:hypothetical protein
VPTFEKDNSKTLEIVIRNLKNIFIESASKPCIRIKNRKSKQIATLIFLSVFRDRYICVFGIRQRVVKYPSNSVLLILVHNAEETEGKKPICLPYGEQNV